jgi:hypothetical protein
LIINDTPPGTLQADGVLYSASWRGCDKWHGVPNQFFGSPADPTQYAPKSLAKGYVRDGVLVLPGLAEVPVFVNGSSARIQDATLAAPLEPVTARGTAGPVRFQMRNAVVAGRLPLTDLIQVAFTSAYSGTYTCKEPALFMSLMDSFCKGIDLAASSTLDFEGKTCESLSFAFRFDADLVDLDRSDRTPPVRLSDVCAGETPPPPETACPILAAGQP